MIFVIDNYDSFTFNLVHYLMELGAEVRATYSPRAPLSPKRCPHAAPKPKLLPPP